MGKLFALLVGIPMALLFIVPIVGHVPLLIGGTMVAAVPAFAMFALLIPLFVGALFVTLIVMMVRRTSHYHETRRMDMHQLQTDISQVKKELQEIKEYLADLTIQLDDERFR